MATIRTKPRKASVPEPTLAPKPSRADVMAMVDGVFRDLCNKAVRNHEAAAETFAEEAAKDPLYAVRWHAQKVAEAHGERNAWADALHAYEAVEGDVGARLAEVKDHMTAAILDAARYPSTVRSTCPFTTAVASYEADARLRALCMVRDMAEVYGRNIAEAGN